MESTAKPQTYFEKIVNPELEILYRTAWNLTKSETEAQDLVQETLLKAFNAIERFDGRYPRAWLLTILRNTNINKGRKKTPDLLKDPDYTFEHSDTFSDHNDPESILIHPLFEASVETAYKALTKDFKQIIDLIDLDGFSYQEAAQKLDVPVGTVMSRLHRARKTIRKNLEGTYNSEVSK